MRSLLKNKKKRRERLDSDLIKLEKRGKGKESFGFHEIIGFYFSLIFANGFTDTANI